MQYAALLPCLISALIGVWISSGMGLAPTAFAVADYAAPTPGNLIRVLLLGLLLAALSIAFCEVIHAAPKLYKKLFPNAYLRVVVGGALIIALTTLLGTTDYNGAGANVIAAAIAGQAVPVCFPAQDAVHQHHTGGRVQGRRDRTHLLHRRDLWLRGGPAAGAGPGLGAALGMVALFCGCTNSPLASSCLAIEVFGGQNIELFALAWCRLLHDVQLLQPVSRAALPPLQTACGGRAARPRQMVGDRFRRGKLIFCHCTARKSVI